MHLLNTFILRRRAPTLVLPTMFAAGALLLVVTAAYGNKPQAPTELLRRGAWYEDARESSDYKAAGHHHASKRGKGKVSPAREYGADSDSGEAYAGGKPTDGGGGGGSKYDRKNNDDDDDDAKNDAKRSTVEYKAGDDKSKKKHDDEASPTTKPSDRDGYKTQKKSGAVVDNNADASASKSNNNKSPTKKTKSSYESAEPRDDDRERSDDDENDDGTKKRGGKKQRSGAGGGGGPASRSKHGERRADSPFSSSYDSHYCSVHGSFSLAMASNYVGRGATVGDKRDDRKPDADRRRDSAGYAKKRRRGDDDANDDDDETNDDDRDDNRDDDGYKRSAVRKHTRQFCRYAAAHSHRACHFCCRVVARSSNTSPEEIVAAVFAFNPTHPTSANGADANAGVVAGYGQQYASGGGGDNYSPQYGINDDDEPYHQCVCCAPVIKYY